MFSVVICTNNRDEYLKMALEAVSSQLGISGPFEVIVVDNSPNPHTEKLVKGSDKAGIDIRYVSERTPGLAQARNTGFRNALGDYVAYIDDDCVVPASWLSAAAEIIQQHDPDIFGGPYSAVHLRQPPGWFDDIFASAGHGDSRRLLKDDEYLSGGNLFIRKIHLFQLGGFRTHLGMNAQRISYGEETEFLSRARKEIPGVRILYDPEISVGHIVRPENYKISRLLMKSLAAGRDTYRIQSRSGNLIGHVVKLLTRGVLLVSVPIRAYLMNLRQEEPYVRQVLRLSTQELHAIGWHVAAISLRLSQATT